MAARAGARNRGQAGRKQSGPPRPAAAVPALLLKVIRLEYLIEREQGWDTENDWNLIYLATAVIVNKSQDEIRDQSLPMKAVLKDSSSELPAAKVQNFKMVVDKLTKKPAPVDPNEEARKEDIARRRARKESV